VCWGVPIRRIGSGCPPQAWLHIVLLEGGGIFSKIFRLVPLPPGLAFCLACGGRLVRIVFIGGICWFALPAFGWVVLWRRRLRLQAR